jgi:hypothetical protein
MLIKPENAPRRRKRSHMSLDECNLAFADLAKRMRRMGESSSVGMFYTTSNPNECAPEGCLTLMVQAKGTFGSNERVFEAMRVLAGYKLPRKG